jgi:hypothetical protein
MVQLLLERTERRGGILRLVGERAVVAVDVRVPTNRRRRLRRAKDAEARRQWFGGRYTRRRRGRQREGCVHGSARCLRRWCLAGSGAAARFGVRVATAFGWLRERRACLLLRKALAEIPALVGADDGGVVAVGGGGCGARVPRGKGGGDGRGVTDVGAWVGTGHAPPTAAHVETDLFDGGETAKEHIALRRRERDPSCQWVSSEQKQMGEQWVSEQRAASSQQTTTGLFQGCRAIDSAVRTVVLAYERRALGDVIAKRLRRMRVLASEACVLPPPHAPSLSEAPDESVTCQHSHSSSTRLSGCLTPQGNPPSHPKGPHPHAPWPSQSMGPHPRLRGDNTTLHCGKGLQLRHTDLVWHGMWSSNGGRVRCPSRACRGRRQT